MKKYLALGALLAFATPAATSAVAQSAFPGLLPSEDSTMTFRAEALRNDAFEIESSRIALERSRSPQVRAYARQTIAERKRTTDALLPPGASLNAAGNVVSDKDDGPFSGPLGFITAPLTIPVRTVSGVFDGPLIDNDPAQPGKRVALDPRRQAELQNLQATTGRRFNQTYASQQVRAQSQNVNLYQEYAKGGTDEDGRTFANQALPTLQAQYGRAYNLEQRYGENGREAF